jgi:hypothetical protein
MSRTFQGEFYAEIIAANCAPATFAFLDFQGGAVRVWDGVGSLTWGGNTYTGLGYLGAVSPIEESADTRANGIVLSVSGVPSSLIASVLGDNYNRREVSVWIGALDAAGALVADPEVAFTGKMNNVDFDKGEKTSIIRIYAESRLVDLLRSRERRYTHEHQQIDFPGDLGLEYMARAQSTPLQWGGARVPTYSGGGSSGGSATDDLQ